MVLNVKHAIKAGIPKPVQEIYRFCRTAEDWTAIISFMSDPSTGLSFRERVVLIQRLLRINANVESPHRQTEILAYLNTILSLPKDTPNGLVVEAGCFKGSSTAKFSLACALAGQKLIVFDSFQGIPTNSEPHTTNIFGGRAGFTAGDYKGTLNEVMYNVSTYGNVDVCHFVPGWFEETLPKFSEHISAIYLDVDLVSSTRTCLKYLYPLLNPGGVLYSQDGHLPLVIELFDNDEFWLRDVGCSKPQIQGLREDKLIKIVKGK